MNHKNHLALEFANNLDRKLSIVKNRKLRKKHPDWHLWEHWSDCTSNRDFYKQTCCKNSSYKVKNFECKRKCRENSRLKWEQHPNGLYTTDKWAAPTTKATNIKG